MDGETVDYLRKSSRDLLDSNRKMQRGEYLDKHRRLPKIRTSKEDITNISNKLKTKSSISAEELSLLKNGLMESEDNIKIVLSTNGAVRGLVRELSGSDVQNQLEAAGCCCNLALGDGKGGLVLAKAMGSYLITLVDSLNWDLAVSCTWALGNLAGAGGGGAGGGAGAVLAAQGAVGKLLLLLQDSCEVAVLDAAVYALTHFLYSMQDDFSQEYLSKLLQSITRHISKIPVWRLIFLASYHSSYTDQVKGNDTFIDTVVSSIPDSVQSYCNCKSKSDSVTNPNCKSKSDSVANYSNCKSKSVCDLVYILRILANTCTDYETADYVMLKSIELNTVYSLKTAIEIQSQNEQVNSALYWFLGNLLRYSSSGVSKTDFFNMLGLNIAT